MEQKKNRKRNHNQAASSEPTSLGSFNDKGLSSDAVDLNADLNQLTADALRAGLMGNKRKESEINDKIRRIKEARAQYQSTGKLPDNVVQEPKNPENVELSTTRLNKFGQLISTNKSYNTIEKDDTIKTEASMSIQELLLNEKNIDTLGDEHILRKKARMATCSKNDKTDMDEYYDMIGDMRTRKEKDRDGDKEEKKRELDMRQMRDRAIAENRKRISDRFNMNSGGNNWPKHCVAYQTPNFAILVSPWKPICGPDIRNSAPGGHYLIVSTQENQCSYLMYIREDLVDEYNRIKTLLRKAIKSAYNLDCLFIQTNFNNGMQTYTEVITIFPRDTPVFLGYFKQEIMTAAGQFGGSNKLIKFDMNTPLQKIFPRAMMPYFIAEIYQEKPDRKTGSVGYSGYFTIIEDNHAFGKNFAYQVICGVENRESYEFRNINKNRDSDDFENCLRRRKELRLLIEEQNAKVKSTDLALPDGFEVKATGLDNIKSNGKAVVKEKVYGIQLPPGFRPDSDSE